MTDPKSPKTESTIVPVVLPPENALQLNAPGIEKSDADLKREFILKSNSEETQRSYRTTLNAFAKFCENKYGRKIEYREIKFSDVRDWRDWMIEAKKRPNTICAKLAGLRSLFEYGRALGIFNHNPASPKLVPPPEKPTNSPGRALTSKEVHSLLAWFRLDELIGARDYALILVMVRLSLRVSEVCSLKVSSITWQSGRWVLTVKVKGGREEKRPLPTDVKKAIDNYLRFDRENRESLKTNNHDAYIFQAAPTQRFFGVNNPISSRHVWHLVKKYSKLSGIGDVTPHDLRRTAITKAFKLRIPIEDIQRMSGHRDINTLLVYKKDVENLENNAINSLNYDSD